MVEDIDMRIWLAVSDELQFQYLRGEVDAEAVVRAGKAALSRRAVPRRPQLYDHVYTYMVEVHTVRVCDVMVRFAVSRKHARSLLIKLLELGMIRRLDVHHWAIYPPGDVDVDVVDTGC